MTEQFRESLVENAPMPIETAEELIKEHHDEIWFWGIMNMLISSRTLRWEWEHRRFIRDEKYMCTTFPLQTVIPPYMERVLKQFMGPEFQNKNIIPKYYVGSSERIWNPKQSDLYLFNGTSKSPLDRMWNNCQEYFRNHPIKVELDPKTVLYCGTCAAPNDNSDEYNIPITIELELYQYLFSIFEFHPKHPEGYVEEPFYPTLIFSHGREDTLSAYELKDIGRHIPRYVGYTITPDEIDTDNFMVCLSTYVRHKSLPIRPNRQEIADAFCVWKYGTAEDGHREIDVSFKDVMGPVPLKNLSLEHQIFKPVI